MDISQLGNNVSGSDSVQCHTDLSTCCREQQGPHRGDWFPPNGGNNRLPFPNEAGDIYEQRTDQKINLLHRNNANRPTGVYRCDISTVAVHDVNPQLTNNSLRETVYVGLYTMDTG